MGVPLSRPIELFIASENAHDTDALAMCFTTNATVTDEGRTMTGLKGIAAWRRQTARKYHHTVEPVAVAARDGRTVVSTKLSGHFPGSPATLDFVFDLEGDKIASLEIES
jgi:SnoaL-like domain